MYILRQRGDKRQDYLSQIINNIIGHIPTHNYKCIVLMYKVNKHASYLKKLYYFQFIFHSIYFRKANISIISNKLQPKSYDSRCQWFNSLLSFHLYRPYSAFAFAIIIGAIAYINKEREGVEICYVTAERPFCDCCLSLAALDVYFS